VKKTPQEELWDFPETYSHVLLAKARHLQKPADVVLNGTFTLFLDKGHHLQHMSMNMRQTNR
jgi:hypothetical protein